MTSWASYPSGTSLSDDAGDQDPVWQKYAIFLLMSHSCRWIEALYKAYWMADWVAAVPSNKCKSVYCKKTKFQFALDGRLSARWQNTATVKDGRKRLSCGYLGMSHPEASLIHDNRPIIYPPIPLPHSSQEPWGLRHIHGVELSGREVGFLCDTIHLHAVNNEELLQCLVAEVYYEDPHHL